MVYLNNILMMLIISYRLRVITGLWETAYNNVASDESAGDGLKYPYKDEEHAEKITSLNRFFVFCSH